MVMVVGAGRGPLVAASLAASVEAGVPIRVYAVEKNANAVICLQNACSPSPTGPSASPSSTRHARVGGAGARRHPRVRALGCGATTSSRPSASTARSASCGRAASRSRATTRRRRAALVAQAVERGEDVQGPRALRDGVRRQGAQRLPARRAQPLFRFVHECRGAARQRAVRQPHVHGEARRGHGFVGYFHSTLYEEVCISTEPSTVSEGCSRGSRSTCRCATPSPSPTAPRSRRTLAPRLAPQVWYEWALTQPTPSPIHNPNGRSYFIGL